MSSDLLPGTRVQRLAGGEVAYEGNVIRWTDRGMVEVRKDDGESRFAYPEMLRAVAGA